MLVSEGDSVVAVRLFDGEDFLESVKKVFLEAGLDSAVIVGIIGMWREVELGADYSKEKGYTVTKLAGPFELVSVQGSVARDEKREPVIHCHACLAKKDFSVIGGHVLGAKANVTNEIFLLKTSGIKAVRKPEPTGLKGLYFE